MASERDRLVCLARLAGDAERYDDMRKAMDEVAKMPNEFSSEERNLLSIAYKNVINARRPAWRVLNPVELKADFENPCLEEARKLLGKEVESEIKEICEQIFTLLNEHLIPKSKTPECQVFFHKMMGDYKRYLAEVASPDDRDKIASDSLAAYETASKIAEKELRSTNPVRLGLSLNFSVFYYEILRNTQEACDMARTALEKATGDLEDFSDDANKDSALIMQLLRDNLTLWTSDVDEHE